MRIVFTLIAAAVMLSAVACFGGSDDSVTPSSATSPASTSPSPPIATPDTLATTPPTAVPTTPPATTITGSRMVVADASGSVGQIVAVDISIHNARTGIAGYAIVVSVVDTSIGRIANVRLPEFGLSIIGDLPAGSVDITAADLPGLLDGDIKEARLATLDIEMLKAGTTELLLELRSVDDDDGNVVIPSLVSGVLSVH